MHYTHNSTFVLRGLDEIIDEQDAAPLKSCNDFRLVLNTDAIALMTQPGVLAREIGLLSLSTLICRPSLILLGLVFYGAGAVAWIAVLSRIDLSLAYPFLALTYVLVALVSRFGLGESLPAVRWVGIIVIGIGIVLIANGNK